MLTGSITIRWKGDAFKRGIKGDLVHRLEKAGRIVRDKAKDLIAERYPPASVPGEPPHKRTGDLRRSVRFAVDNGKLVVIIGSWIEARTRHHEDNHYPLWLELGTRKMRARPWLRPALQESFSEIQSLFSEKLDGAAAELKRAPWKLLFQYHYRKFVRP